MWRSLFSREYGPLRALLVEMRQAAGLSQRGLARRLGREHSFVARIEQGERRLDVVEFLWLCQACHADPTRMMLDLVHRIHDRPSRSRRAR